MANLISVSRRTDVPRYYAPWFIERRRVGRAEYRNAFGISGSVSLRPDDVLGYVFWTRDPRPLGDEIRRILDEGTPVAVQFTITPYGVELEPLRPSRAESIEAVHWLAQVLPGPPAIQWRYDPIVLSDRYPVAFHVEQFAALAAELGSFVRVVNVSFVEPYRKAVERIADRSVHYRRPEAGRHRWTERGSPSVRFADASDQGLVEQLAELGRKHGLEVRACCDPSWSLPAAACLGADLFAGYPTDLSAPIEALDRAPSRSFCRCRRAVDIGTPNTCVAGCRYCYVLTSEQSARGNHARHHSAAAGLIVPASDRRR